MPWTEMAMSIGNDNVDISSIGMCQAGQTPVYVTSDPIDRHGAIICCGDSFCYMRLDEEGNDPCAIDGITLTSIWLSDISLVSCRLRKLLI